MPRPLACLLLALLAQPLAAEDRFRLRIDLSDEAAARLSAEGRWIEVAAGYYGEARPGAPEDDWSRARLGTETFTVFPASQVVELGGSLAAMPRDRVEEPRVDIRVTTEGTPDLPELLLCDRLDRTLAGLAEDGEALVECILRED